MAENSVFVKYEEFFELPKSPRSNEECSAKCRLCPPGHKPYKYTLNSKGNLLKHLQTVHLQRLRDHKERRSKEATEASSSQRTLEKNGSLSRQSFKKQEIIATSIVRNLCGHGGLPLSTVEQQWFRTFMRDVEPRFQPVSRHSVSSKLDSLYEQEKSILLNEISSSVVGKPSVTLDFWTGCDNRSFMGCTVHYMHEQKLKNHMLFFVEVPPPHTAEHIKVRFEDELEKYGVSCFVVVTDNASNMKCVFEIDESDNMECDEDDKEDSDDIDADGCGNEAMNALKQWTPKELKFDEWLGCAAHQMQLVVNDGYKELSGYRRVQAAFSKAKSISAYSRRSSHFAYALSLKIPAPNDTRWNSYFKLHAHIVKYCDSINKALEHKKVNRKELIISKADKEVLSLVVDVMQYFSEATNILQTEDKPTCNHVITVVDSLENALLQTRRGNAAINALCERLLTSLWNHFQYLLSSKIHLAATVLDPRIKLSFTDHCKEGKVFVFDSSDVEHAVKSLLPSYSPSKYHHQSTESTV